MSGISSNLDTFFVDLHWCWKCRWNRFSCWLNKLNTAYQVTDSRRNSDYSCLLWKIFKAIPPTFPGTLKQSHLPLPMLEGFLTKHCPFLKEFQPTLPTPKGILINSHPWRNSDQFCWFLKEFRATLPIPEIIPTNFTHLWRNFDHLCLFLKEFGATLPILDGRTCMPHMPISKEFLLALPTPEDILVSSTNS